VIYSRDNFVVLGEEKKGQREFNFCRLCEFYPCELICSPRADQE